MSKCEILAGATDQTIDLFIRDSSSTTGGGLTGLAYNTASLVCYYRKGATSTPTALTLATQTVGGAHSDGGFVAVDGTNCPGQYRLDLSDTIVATAGRVTLYLKGATNMAPCVVEIEVVAVDKYNATRMGLTALPNAAADAAGGLPISDAGGLDLDARLDAAITSRMASYTQPTGFLAATFPGTVASTTNITAATGIDVTKLGGSTQSATDLKDFADTGYDPVTHWAKVTIEAIGGNASGVSNLNDFVVSGYDPALHKILLVDTVTNLTNAPTAGDFTATMKTSITAAVPDTGAIAGAVGSQITSDHGAGSYERNTEPPTAVENRTEMDSNSTKLAALDSRLTSSRAGYLDNLNVGGAVASQADINALNQSASRRIILTTVGQYERPESSSTTFQIEARTYSADGAAVDADSTPTLTATGITSGSLAANLGSATNPSTGVYRWTYSVASSATLEQIRFDLSAVISSDTQTMSVHSQVVDSVAATFTTGDRTKLEAVYDKLPSKAYITGTANADGDVQADEATGNFPGSVGSVVGAVGSVTAAVSVTGDLSATMKTSVNTEVAAALATYDGPTNAEMVARTLASASYATATALGTTDTAVQTLTTRVGIPAVSVSDDLAAVKTDTGNLVTRITSTLFSGITSLAQMLGIMAGKQVGDTTARNELRATGAGSGTFDETTDSMQAVRDRGDAAWTTATGFAVPGSAMTLTTGERTAVANEVETQIIDDTDSEKVLEAIVNKIAAANPSLEDLTLAAIASAVRTELATELARIDAAITTRLASASYTAPPSASTNASAVRTELTAELGRIDAAITTRATPAQVATELATYDGPTNAEMEARTLLSASYAEPGDEMTLADSEDVYPADIGFTIDDTNSRDEYTVVWFRNGAPVTSGITVPTIQAIKRANGTDLIPSSVMTQIGATGAYKYDAVTTERATPGEAVVVVVSATINGATRTWRKVITRDVEVV